MGVDGMSEITIKDIVKYMLEQAGWGKGLEVVEVGSLVANSYDMTVMPDCKVTSNEYSKRDLKVFTFPLDRMAILTNPFAFKPIKIVWGMDMRCLAFHVLED